MFFLCILDTLADDLCGRFVISALAKHGYIKDTPYWTVTNISDGLNALCISVEMVLFAVWMAYVEVLPRYQGQSSC